jgi:DNA (cytosine-5)-methyltransferase 1
MSRLLSVSEAAKYLGVSTKTLRRWDTDGRLVARRDPMNGYRLYDVRDLDALREGTVRPRGVRAYGRDAEIAALRARVALGGAVVCGAPGIGKSTVVRAAFPTAARWEVEPSDARIATITEPTWIDPVDSIDWELLRAHRERPWILVARGGCPPDFEALTVEPLGASAAEAVLTEALEALEAPPLDEGDVSAVLELFGGNPLALEMVAPLMAALPAADALRRLRRHELSLRHPRRDAPPHHSSFDAALDASARALTPSARRLSELVCLHDAEVEVDSLRAMHDHEDFDVDLVALVRAGLVMQPERHDRVAAERASAWSSAPRASAAVNERFTRFWLDRARRGDLRGAARHVLRAARYAPPERAAELFEAAYPLWLDRGLHEADEIVAWVEGSRPDRLHGVRAIVHALRGRGGSAARALAQSRREDDPFAHALATLYTTRGPDADAAASRAMGDATTPEQRSWVAEAHLFVAAFGPSGAEERALVERHAPSLAPLALDTWRLDVLAAPPADQVDPVARTLLLDHRSPSRRVLRAIRVARAWLTGGQAPSAVALLRHAVSWSHDAGEAIELRARLQKVRAHLLAAEAIDALDEAERARAIAAASGADGELFESLVLRGLASARVAPTAAVDELEDASRHAAPSSLPRELVVGWRHVLEWPSGEVPDTLAANARGWLPELFAFSEPSRRSTRTATARTLAEVHRFARAAWRDSVEGRLTFALVADVLEASGLPRHTLVLDDVPTLDDQVVPTTWARTLAALRDAGGAGLDTEQLAEVAFDGSDAESARRVYATVHGLRSWELPIRHDDGAYRLACPIQVVTR